MRDDLQMPLGQPMNDEGEGTQRDDEETEKIDEQISDDPVVEEEGEIYDPAVQAPPEAER